MFYSSVTSAQQKLCRRTFKLCTIRTKQTKVPVRYGPLNYYRRPCQSPRFITDKFAPGKLDTKFPRFLILISGRRVPFIYLTVINGARFFKIYS